jgi:hypothetical protein
MRDGGWPWRRLIAPLGALTVCAVVSSAVVTQASPRTFETRGRPTVAASVGNDAALAERRAVPRLGDRGDERLSADAPMIAADHVPCSAAVIDGPPSIHHSASGSFAVPRRGPPRSRCD